MGSASAQSPGEDWFGTAEVKEIRSLYDRIEQDLMTGDVRLARSGWCEEAFAQLFHDSSAVVRKYSLLAQTEHLTGEAHYYYDEKGVLRFSYRAFRSDNGTHSQTRVYFDSLGRRVGRDDRLLAGPGYQGGYDHDVYTPSEHFRACGSRVR